MKSTDLLINTSGKHSGAEIKSHKYLLKTCMVKQVSSGIYIWHPYGLYILRNIENIIRKFHEEAGILEFISPIVQPFSLWEESGRGNSYGKETLRIFDRNNTEYIYGPTAEEIAAEIMKQYNNQNISIYQIQWKFRDEIRPRYGLLRSREFLMKDAYSFNDSEENAMKTYIMFFNLYMKIFSHLDLTVYPFIAESGPIGGSYTHEFNILSKIGDSDLYYDHELVSNQEFHSYKEFGKAFGEGESKSKGIEVGQIFLIGKKYTKNSIMGCYGIGVSRIVSALIEEYFDEENQRMHWPASIRQFDFGIIDGDESDRGQEIYKQLKKAIYDDRNVDIANKINDLKLIGVENILVVRKDNIKYLNKDNEWIEINESQIQNL